MERIEALHIDNLREGDEIRLTPLVDTVLFSFRMIGVFSRQLNVQNVRYGFLNKSEYQTLILTDFSANLPEPFANLHTVCATNIAYIELTLSILS